MIRRFAQAARFIDRTGFCLLFPAKGLNLPSLWAAVKGRNPRNFNLVAAWDTDAERLWSWKDDFPRRRRAYYGRYFRGRASLIALAYLPCFYRLEGNYGTEDEAEQLYREGRLAADARAVCAALARHGPLPVLELRHALGWGSKAGNRRFKRALDQLQRRLLLVRWGTAAETEAWESAVYELTPRAFPRAMRLAADLSREEARRRIVDRYRQLNPRAAARDTARLFGWARPDAERAFR